MKPILERARAVLESTPVKILLLVSPIISITSAVISRLDIPSLNSLRTILLVTAAAIAAFWLLVLIPTAMEGHRERMKRERLRQEKMIEQAVQAERQDIKAIMDAVVGELGRDISDIPHRVRQALHPLLLVDEGAQWALAHEINAARYGWSYEKLAVTVTINPDGSAEFKREATVKALKELDLIEQSLQIDPASVDTSSCLIARPRYSVESLSGSRVKIDLSEPYFADGVWVVDLRFNPSLEADSVTSFVLIERLLAGVYAIGWLPQRLKDEEVFDQYYAFRIDRPIRELIMRVFLPVGYRAEGYKVQVRSMPPVRTTRPKRNDPVEEGRIKGNLIVSGPTGNRFELMLRVAWPVLGRVYVIRWDPLSTEKTL